jgi:lysophospholipase L1-like esterase
MSLLSCLPLLVLAVMPVPRASEPAWRARDAKIDANAAKNAADVVLVGDSITQGWELNQPVWDARFPHTVAVNAGIASDRVEHILWRVENGVFAKARPKVVVLLAGVNNLAIASPEQIAAGDAAIIAAIQKRSPDSKILLMGLLPSGHEPNHKRRPQIKAVNALLEKLADGERVRYLDIGSALLEKDGTLPKTTSFDYLHLTRAGYAKWADALQQPIKEMLAGKASTH